MENESHPFGAVIAALAATVGATVVALLWWHFRRLASQASAWRLRLLHAQDDERQRIARDIHDDVVQRLSAAQMRIDSLDIAAAGALVSGVAHDLRTLAHDLYPSSLQHLSLGEALADLAASVGEDGPRLVFLDCTGNGELTSAVTAALYRTAQEALQNVRKHSRACVVQISLSYDREGVTMRVQDDGIGIGERALRNGGFGMRSMETRLVSIGGTLEIVRVHGAPGTILTARAPLS